MVSGRIESGYSRQTQICLGGGGVVGVTMKVHPRNSTMCPKGHHQGGERTSLCKALLLFIRGSGGMKEVSTTRARNGGT
jgi:hypothetical protein